MNTVTRFPSSTADRAIAYTMRWEGGWSDDPRDPGGATNYGISLRFLLDLGHIEAYDFDGDGDVDAADVRAMTFEKAQEIYLTEFWRPGLNTLPEISAIKLFDFGVNMGPVQSTKLFQRAVNEYLFTVKGAPLIVDGAWGERTAGAIASLDEATWTLVLGDLEDRAARFYFELADKRRAARDYLFGWLRRCYSRPEIP